MGRNDSDGYCDGCVYRKYGTAQYTVDRIFTGSGFDHIDAGWSRGFMDGTDGNRGRFRLDEKIGREDAADFKISFPGDTGRTPGGKADQREFCGQSIRTWMGCDASGTYGDGKSGGVEWT